jgi:hypothetical protein
MLGAQSVMQASCRNGWSSAGGAGALVAPVPS